jgi:predicted methyltransferase
MKWDVIEVNGAAMSIENAEFRSQFSGVKPGDAVADFNASVGYFTRVFSDVVASRGHVYAIEPVEIQQYNSGCGLRQDHSSEVTARSAAPCDDLRFPGRTPQSCGAMGRTQPTATLYSGRCVWLAIGWPAPM